MPKSSFQHLAYFLHRLWRLKNYVEFSETNWEEKLASYNLSLDDDDLNLKSFGGHRDHWADLANEFPQYHRRASFLMIFAMLEDDLAQLCKSVAAEQKLTTPLADISDRGIDRSKAYLSKVAGIAFPANTTEWDRIKAFRDIRNVLIHAAGYLDPTNPQHERVKKFSGSQASGLSVKHYARSQVSMEVEFLPSVIITLERFYELLIVATKAKP
jgi:hypothetical protein